MPSAQASTSDAQDAQASPAPVKPDVTTASGRPVTRTARLSAIEHALTTHVVTSQAQLAQLLRADGFEVTQATLSRDLDEMNAVKMRMPDGSTAYAINETGFDVTMPNGYDDARAKAQMAKVLVGLVTSVARAFNQVVVHTNSGAAQYVGSIIDRNSSDDVLGTIAGDDTILLICTDAASAQSIAQWLLSLT
ncbi:arginine repressor [Bifidobacterium gallicum]|nr:arginine repressor, C-terminal domain protein [Bifidobacterium gallicum DSM 20093 = LMG 11596]